MSIDWSKVESSPETKQKVEGKVLLDLRAKIVDLEQDLYKTKEKLSDTEKKLSLSLIHI